VTDYIKNDVLFTVVCLYGNWAAINQFLRNCVSITKVGNASWWH